MLSEPAVCNIVVPKGFLFFVSTSCITSSSSRKPARLLLGDSAATPRCAPLQCRVAALGSAPDGPTHSVIGLRDVVRTALTVTPTRRGPFQAQCDEVLGVIQEVLAGQSERIALTAQTIFLARQEDRAKCEQLFRAALGDSLPTTLYVVQPPCSGAALAVEAWGIGGLGVTVKHHSPRSLSVAYGGIRWIHCAGVEPGVDAFNAHAQTHEVMNDLGRELRTADAEWDEVVRTWFYLGDVTGEEPGGQRYREFNLARTESFSDIHFGRTLTRGRNGHSIYPASTGIGMLGRGLAAGCLALQTDRPDVRLVALENPGQVPAYCYEKKYSPASPKFARAMAVLLGDYATTWVSGTASILNSESVFPDDIKRQTNQTLDNIERLIAPENFALHGVPRAGATLGDLAKVRVYVKRPEDYARCRAVCEQRLGHLPAIYAIADVCRPELLVEIEGVAFSPIGPGATTDGKVVR